MTLLFRVEAIALFLQNFTERQLEVTETILFIKRCYNLSFLEQVNVFLDQSGYQNKLTINSL